MLSLIFATVLTSETFTRSSQAEFLDPVTCLLTIDDCTPTPPADTTQPTASVNGAPNPAGGASQVVTISGTLSDDTELASYTLLINGNAVQQATDLTGTSVAISYAWNVASPSTVPSGTYTVTLDVADKAGNTNQTTTTVDVDNDAPAVTIGGGGIIKSGSITPNVTATDGHNIVGYQWTASSSNPEVLSFDASAMEPTFTPSVEGTYAFYLQVTDSLGNTSSNNEFDFGYKQDFETVPLPPITDPSGSLIDTSPSTPDIVPASSNPIVKVGRDDMTNPDDAEVLGNTVTSSTQKPSTKTIATIAPTGSGWSIFGVLWYWWLVILATLFAVWYFVKKIVASRIAEKS